MTPTREFKPQVSETAHSDSLDRRTFLEIFGSGVFVFFSTEDSYLLGQGQRGSRAYPEDFNAYLRIGEDGHVSCFTGKVELGQGIIAALAQILAEELEVPYAAVTMVMGDTKLCPWDGGTNGSRSVKYFGPALRAAGAEAREVLIRLAAERLQASPERLVVKDGVVRDKANPEKSISYGALAMGKTIERHLGSKPELKPVSTYTVSGRPLPRADATAKVTGRAKYAGDIRLPGMFYGRVLRPPAHGARLKSLDASGAKQVKDARVLQEGDFVGVVHPLPDQAELALSRIKAEYDVPEVKTDDKTIHERLMSSTPRENVVEQRGDLGQGLELSSLKFDETYFTPYVAHAPMETHSALARVDREGATFWIGTQRPFGAVEELAGVLGIAPDKIQVITPYVGGGFGGKSQIGQAVQAARLSKMTGSPVQVVWSREEEFFYDTFQPAAVVRIKSGLDGSNRIVYWDYQVSFAGERSSQNFYDVPHVRTVSRGGFSAGSASPHPFGTGAWRGPGSNTNIFARESHIDVMAARARMDPLEFRLKNLADQRMTRVLKAAADKFGWKPAKAPSGMGHGVVCLDYLNTYVAAMAEIAVDRNTGRIRVDRIVAAQDMGLIINPEGARRQMEGAITMGLGYCLAEEIHFKGGEIKDLSFIDYEITHFSWVPKIETVLIDNPNLPAQGGGEPPITCMGGLMANALFDAVGVRLNRLPLTPERIKTSLSKSSG